MATFCLAEKEGKESQIEATIPPDQSIEPLCIVDDNDDDQPGNDDKVDTIAQEASVKFSDISPPLHEESTSTIPPDQSVEPPCIVDDNDDDQPGNDDKVDTIAQEASVKFSDISPPLDEESTKENGSSQLPNGGAKESR